jgi:hypothetical protein
MSYKELEGKKDSTVPAIFIIGLETESKIRSTKKGKLTLSSLRERMHHDGTSCSND